MRFNSVVGFLQEQSCTDEQLLQHTFIQHVVNKLGRPERAPEQTDDWVEEIYAVLALMPPSKRGSGQFEALCEALWAARDGPLKEERVLSSLLRPQCDVLVSAYCSTALRLQRDHLLRTAPDTQGRCFTRITVMCERSGTFVSGLICVCGTSSN